MCADKTLQLSEVRERKACLLSDQQREQSALAALRLSATAVHKPLQGTHSFCGQASAKKPAPFLSSKILK